MKAPKVCGHVSINGDLWAIYSLSDEEYSAYFGPESSATTALGKQPPKRRQRFIAFDTSNCDWVTIVHEVTHAYFFTQYIESASVTQEQMEEIVCDFLGYKIEAILRTSKEVSKLIRKARLGK